MKWSLGTDVCFRGVTNWCNQGESNGTGSCSGSKEGAVLTKICQLSRLSLSLFYQSSLMASTIRLLFELHTESKISWSRMPTWWYIPHMQLVRYLPFELYLLLNARHSGILCQFDWVILLHRTQGKFIGGAVLPSHFDTLAVVIFLLPSPLLLLCVALWDRNCFDILHMAVDLVFKKHCL